MDAQSGPVGSEAFGRFFLPGPTEVRPEVLASQARPMIGHRGAAIQELMGEIQVGLRSVFRTERPVLVSSSSATGFMEAGIRNGAPRKVLSLVNGAFSERFAEIAEACGVEVDRIEVPWGRAPDPHALADALRAGSYDAVTVVHSETSTGVLNPIEDFASVVAKFPGTFLLVDSVTGVGGAPVHTDEWGLDFVLTGSQKALALPPGLAFAVASEALMERSTTMTGKGVYFDLVAFARNLEKLQTPNTPAVSLLYALREQLAHIEAETMEARWARHARMAQRTGEWVDAMASDRGIPLRVLAPVGFRSPTVTCVELPEGVRGPSVVASMRDRGWTIGGGYGKLKEETIRIGHMGDHTVEELDDLLGELTEVLS
ncbi:MAG: alanine--glyoxylate aminotransferase family protein [Gemmatimonadota bacterium]|nr:alanine--glyoxylate aminotransferase family protein [Gemmatimonadota bacterium]MDH5758189.1 alanine--glyoxylate aminotransferase family protein [Gemmatimonadota bacterium]